jgi:very-short-patch-repair endonuclease
MGVPRESASKHRMGASARTRAGGVDARVAELAGRQFGVVSRSQLNELGLGRRAVQRRVEAGRLHPLYPGVFSVGHRLVPRQGWWLAAVLASGPDALLSHWSAAALWMIRPNSRSRIDVTVPHRSRSSDPIFRHVSAVPVDERAVEEGIPVTSVHRTILDLAATEPVDTVRAMIKEAGHHRHYDRLSLPALLGRYPGRRGVKRVSLALKRLEEDPAGRPRSPLEEKFLPFICRFQLPRPRLNDWILLGPERFQVDCHWPRSRLIVELDSWKSHGTRSSFRSDRERDRALLLAGYRVTRLTWAQLDDEPLQIARDIRALLENQNRPGRARLEALAHDP